jgi:adenylate cyclase
MPILTLALKGAILIVMGRTVEGAQALERSVELAREHEEVEALGWAYSIYSWVAMITGETEGFFERVAEGVEIAEHLGNSWSRVLAWTSLARLHLLAGRWTEAIQACEQARGIAQERRVGLVNEASVLSMLADAHLGLGDPALACSLAREAIEAGQRYQTKVFEGLAHLTLARALRRGADQGAHVEIEAALSRALELVRETGAQSLEPFVRVEMAELARLEGDEQAREREHTEAQRLFVRIGAPGQAARLAASPEALLA